MTDGPWLDYAPQKGAKAPPLPADDGPWKDYAPAPKANGGHSIAQVSGPGSTIGAMVGAGAPIAPQEPVGVAEDMARAVPSGLAKGTAGLAALPNAVAGLADRAARLPGKAFGMTDADFEAQPKSPFDMSSEGTAANKLNPGHVTQAVSGAILQAAKPILYEPKTTAGKYTEAVAEAIPGAAAGPGGIAAKLIMSAGSGVGSQYLGDRFKGTSYEGVARFVGAVLGGGAAAASKLGGTAEQIFREGLKGVEPTTLVKAAGIMKEASGQGIKLSAAEAVAQAQGSSTRLNEIQRMVEQSRGGSPVMKEFYKDRPAEVQAAGAKALDEVQPQTLDPVQTGIRAQAGSQAILDDTGRSIEIASGLDQVSGMVPSVPGVAERPAVAGALNKAGEVAANEGKPLPMVTRDEAGNIVPSYAAEQFAAGSRQRVDKAIGDAFGDRGQLATEEQVIAQRAKDADPLYEQARAATIPDGAMPVDLLRRLKVSGALQSAIQKMRIDGKPFDIGKVEAWDYMKRALDDKIGAAVRKGANNDARIYGGLKDKLTEAVDAAVPAYAQARASFAGHSEMLDALKNGGKAISAPREQVAREFGALKTPGEQQMYRLGLGNAVREKLAGASDAASPPHVVAGSPALREKMAAVAEPGKMQGLNLALANEEKGFTTATAPDAQAYLRAYGILADKAEAATGAEAAGLGSARDSVRGVLAQNPAIDKAMTAADQLRQSQLVPLQKGPIGKFAGTSDSAQQIESVFPNAPQAGSDTVVGNAVKALAKKDPEAAANVVGQHLRTAFAEATQNNMGGPNQWGGAKFAAQLMGNPEQAKVLEAAVRALPHGNSRWDGFQKFTEVLEATGKRLQAGSPTEPNRLITAELKRGGKVAGAAMSVVTSPFSPMKSLEKVRDYFLLGRNSEKLAKIFTDRSATGLLARIAKEPAGSPAAAVFALRLGLIAEPKLKDALEGPSRH